MTLISSIHQPSSNVFYIFDKLVLLADGNIVYCGPPAKCMAYFASLGHAPPGDYNPADFVMDLVNSTAPPSIAIDDLAKDQTVGEAPSDSPEAPSEVLSIRAQLIKAWDNSDIDAEVNEELVNKLRKGTASPGTEDSLEDDEDDSIPHGMKYPASYWTQFSTLFGRALIVSQKNSMTNLQFYQTIGLALICGFCWFDMEYSEDRIQDRSGFIFFFMTFWFFMTLFQGMMQFLPERTIILKERASGSYRLSAYYISKSVSELPVRLALPLMFLIISFPMSSLSSSVEVFFKVVGVQLLAALAGESIGIFVGTTTLDFEKAMVTATLVSMALMLTGGYFVQQLPNFVHWVRLISPFKYSYDACLRLVFSKDVRCDNGDFLVECTDPSVKTVSPEVALDYLNQQGSVGFNVGLLVVFIIVFRIAAYLTLRFVPHNNGRK